MPNPHTLLLLSELSPVTSSAGEFINTEACCPIMKAIEPTFCSEIRAISAQEEPPNASDDKGTGPRAKYKARQRGSGGRLRSMHLCR